MEPFQHKNPPRSVREDMDCEENVLAKEDNNIYVGRYIPTQSSARNFQPWSEIVGPSLRPQYHIGWKNQPNKAVQEEDIEKSKPYKTIQVLIGKKPRNKGKINLEKDDVMNEIQK